MNDDRRETIARALQRWTQAHWGARDVPLMDECRAMADAVLAVLAALPSEGWEYEQVGYFDVLVNDAGEYRGLAGTVYPNRITEAMPEAFIRRRVDGATPPPESFDAALREERRRQGVCVHCGISESAAVREAVMEGERRIDALERAGAAPPEPERAHGLPGDENGTYPTYSVPFVEHGCARNGVTVTGPEWMLDVRSGREVSLDECISEVVVTLWDAGVVTLGSCCGHGERAPSLVLGDHQDAVEVETLLGGMDPTRRWALHQWRLVECTPAALSGQQDTEVRVMGFPHPDEMCQHQHGGNVWCRLPKGHHGRHACIGHCEITWENAATTDPCTSTEVAVLGVAGGPVRLRCGMLADHDGMHRYSMMWSGQQDTTEAHDG